MDCNSAREVDPDGTPANIPGAKLDSGKARVALCLMGFEPALHRARLYLEGVTIFSEPRTLRGSVYATLAWAARRWPRALYEVSLVTTAGAAKYTPNGWREVPNGVARYTDAFGRHLLAYGAGQVRDDGEGGTNCLHAAQMCWNLAAALSLACARSQAQIVPGFLSDTLVEMLCDALDELESDLTAQEA